jgi:hypothetical protein
MTIKSVREISFFQNLRDKDISLCFCNFIPDSGSEETVFFMNHLVSMAKNELLENENNQLAHLEKDCLSSLSRKLDKHTLDMRNDYSHVKGTVEAFRSRNSCMHAFQISGKVTLSFIELIHLHNVLAYFEDNYDSFKAGIDNSNIPHQLVKFTLVPSAYYSALSSIKNRLEKKLGELIINSYKIKNK